jgi:hypothetical protein
MAEVPGQIIGRIEKLLPLACRSLVESQYPRLSASKTPADRG